MSDKPVAKRGECESCGGTHRRLRLHSGGYYLCVSCREHWDRYYAVGAAGPSKEEASDG